MAIELQPVPPIRDLSKPQDVRRLMEHLNAIQVQIGRISDNADLPDTPTAIAVRQGAGKVVEVVATFAEPPFSWVAECWRGTTNDVTVASKIATETSHTFHDTNVSYASTYYYWVRTVGLNGVNFSGWSPSSSHSITVSKVVTGDINALAITSAELAGGSVLTSKVAPLAITSAELAGGSVLTSKVAPLAITSSELASSSVLTAKLADLNVTTGKLNDLAVATGKIAANAVTVNGAYSNDATSSGITSEAEVGTITITTDGGAVVIQGKMVASMTAHATNLSVFDFRLRKDSVTGTMLDAVSCVFPVGSLRIQIGIPLIAIDGSPASSQTYKLTAEIASWPGTLDVSYRRITSYNLKK